MPNPMQPTNLFATPFAQNGNKTIIPPDGDVTGGRANLLDGFSFVNQRPISLGGVAPSREDFNGILYMLSAFAYFAQSGGVFSYDSSLDYDTPAVVFHNGRLWFCLQANGANSAVAEPGSDDNYWEDYLSYLNPGLADLAQLAADINGLISQALQQMATAGRSGDCLVAWLNVPVVTIFDVIVGAGGDPAEAQEAGEVGAGGGSGVQSASGAIGLCAGAENDNGWAWDDEDEFGELPGRGDGVTEIVIDEMRFRGAPGQPGGEPNGNYGGAGGRGGALIGSNDEYGGSPGAGGNGGRGANANTDDAVLGEPGADGIVIFEW